LRLVGPRAFPNAREIHFVPLHGGLPLDYQLHNFRQRLLGLQLDILLWGDFEGNAMPLYDAFISYSHIKDKPVATALQSVIQQLGKARYRGEPCVSSGMILPFRNP
jgi:hypothetical protein